MLPVEATRQAALFPQSVASGRSEGGWGSAVDAGRADGADGVRRLEGAMVGWQIATDEEFTGSSVLVAGVARLSAATDFTVKVAVANAVLQPFTHYYYRFLYRSVGEPGWAGSRRCRPRRPGWRSYGWGLWCARTTETATTTR